MSSEKGKAARCCTSGRPQKTTVWDGSNKDSVACTYTESKCEFGNGGPTEKGSDAGRMHTRDEGAPAGPDPVGGGGAPWLWAHKNSQCSSVHHPEKTLLVYPQGFETTRTGRAKGAKSGGGIRGEIGDLSPQSAKRLRRKLMTLQGPEGWERWAYTFTSHTELDPEGWRGSWKNFRDRLLRANVPMIWRVELQPKRRGGEGVPHLHAVVWIPPKGDPRRKKVMRLLREGWLECIGDIDDTAAWKHAVHGVPCDDRAFSAYVAAHTSKGKRAQLGWKGRQWGVVNRDHLRDVAVTEYRFTVPGQEVWFDRFLERYLRANWKGKKKRRIKVSRTNGQCRFLAPETVKRLVWCSYTVAKIHPKAEGAPITREDLESGEITINQGKR